MFINLEQYEKTLFFHGLTMIERLQGPLDQWRKLLAAINNTALSEALQREEESYKVDSAQLYAFTIMTKDALKRVSAEEQAKWLVGIDLYQREILGELWKLKWNIYAEWNNCLASIDHYNRTMEQIAPRIAPEVIHHEGQSTISWYMAPLARIIDPTDMQGLFRMAQDTSVHTASTLLDALQAQLKNYARVFCIDDQQLGVVRALSKLEQLTQVVYKNSIPQIVDMLGAPPREYIHQFIVFKEGLLKTATTQLALAAKGWQAAVASEQGVLSILTDYLDLLLFKNLEKQPRGLAAAINTVSSSHFLEQSLIAESEKVFIHKVFSK